jgi:uncharacterized SAM-binding protein YcdF (DUF218 family)
MTAMSSTSSFPRKAVIIVSVLIMVILLDLLVASLYIRQSKRMTTELPFEKTDCALVFMGDFSADGLGPVTQRRLGHVLSLYEQGRVGRIICTGGARPRSGVYGSRMARDWLARAGIPEGDILVEDRSCDTVTNILHGFALATDHNCTSLALVSSPIHLRRIAQIRDDLPSEQFLHYALSPYDPAHQKPRLRALDQMLAVHHEWLATAMQHILPKATINWIRDEVRECRLNIGFGDDGKQLSRSRI